jgi:3'-phosphoadenosine 5'-phosphosulfate sulfotransferase (PAPS reductase)/FAD synthetase
MKKYISFSGGVESTTMYVLYGKGATAIWVDTGAEHEEMYQRIDYAESKIKELHNGDFELIRLKANVKYKGEYYQDLEEYITAIKFMPSQQRRFCTIEFKIKPIDNFLSQEECELLIGFNFDEQGRTGNLEKQSNIKYSYPLIDDGLTRDDCEDILKLHNLHPEFPVYMLRGGCRMCFFKSEKEYKALYHLNRKEFDEVLAFEEKIQDQRKKFYSIMGNGKSLRQLAQECDSELFKDTKSLYDAYKKEAKSCGAFCRR